VAAAIVDTEQQFTCLHFQRDGNGGASITVLNCVIDQVGKHLLQPIAIKMTDCATHRTQMNIGLGVDGSGLVDYPFAGRTYIYKHFLFIGMPSPT
jgi:hypothetical protein